MRSRKPLRPRGPRRPAPPGGGVRRPCTEEGPAAGPGSAAAVELPPALPECSGLVEVPTAPGLRTGLVALPEQPIRLADALAMSLRNVETVQANLSVRTATVARFEALKAFVPLVNLPTFAVGFSRVTRAPQGNVIFPDVTGGTPLRRPARPELRATSIDLISSCHSTLPGRSPPCRSPRRGSGARS